MGLTALADHRAVLRRRPGRRGPADRRRGRGDADRPVRPGLRPARHRGLRHRPGPGGAGLAVDYAKERQQFGSAIAEFQGIQFLLAEMAAAVDTARATYLMAARKRDAGRPFTRDAAVAKMVATDAAMRVTTDAVQVLGGYGYTRDFPAERYMREAKVTQIFEGTNQIQRLVIARQLLQSVCMQAGATATSSWSPAARPGWAPATVRAGGRGRGPGGDPGPARLARRGAGRRAGRRVRVRRRPTSATRTGAGGGRRRPRETRHRCGSRSTAPGWPRRAG